MPRTSLRLLNGIRRRGRPRYNWRQKRSTWAISSVPGVKQHKVGNYENLTEKYGAVSFILAVICAWCHLRGSVRPIGWTIRNSGREANSRGVAADGGADCALSRCLGLTDTRCGNISHGNCRGRSLGTGPSEPQGKWPSQRCGPTTLGSEHQGDHPVPLRARQLGQEPCLDICARRGLPKSIRGCNGRGESQPGTRASLLTCEEHLTGEGGDRREDDRH